MANLSISSLLAEFIMSLSSIARSHRPSKQYLKMVASEIGVTVCTVHLDSEFPASVLSESDGALSVPSRLFDFISKLLFAVLSSYIIYLIMRKNKGQEIF